MCNCSADDLVAHKVFAGCDLDWGDVERVVIRQNGKLNLNQISPNSNRCSNSKAMLKRWTSWSQKSRDQLDMGVDNPAYRNYDSCMVNLW